MWLNILFPLMNESMYYWLIENEKENKSNWLDPSSMQQVVHWFQLGSNEEIASEHDEELVDEQQVMQWVLLQKLMSNTISILFENKNLLIIIDLLEWHHHQSYHYVNEENRRVNQSFLLTNPSLQPPILYMLDLFPILF